MNFNIRRALDSDIPQIIELAASALKDSIPSTREVEISKISEFRKKDLSSLPTLLTYPTVGIFVAETESGEFAGHVLGYIGDIESVTGEIQGWIFELAVMPKFRRMGVAKMLMDRFCEFVRSAGFKYVGLLVTSENMPALKLYETLGFQEERKRMVKKLL